jgi:hypothetical protein
MGRRARVTSPERTERERKIATVLGLRMQGWSLREIGEALTPQISAQAVFKTIKRALERMGEATEQARQIRSFDRQTQERFLSPEASRQVHFDRHSGSRTNCGFFARVSGFAQAGNPAARIGPMSRIRSASLLSAVPVTPSMVRSGKC